MAILIHEIGKNILLVGLSRILGVLILFGSLFLRIPQIVAIFKAKSAAGVSMNMYHLENIVCIIAAAYGYRISMPFGTYGESYSILIQNCVIIGQIHLYNEKINVFVALFTASWFCLFLSIIPIFVLNWMIILIWKLYQEGSAGSVSILMFIVSTCGSLARVFTTLTEVSDDFILLGCISSFLLNAVITAQLFYYKITEKSVIDEKIALKINL